jgi:hypothetical protein
MELTLLTIPGCPNAAVFEERLAIALAGYPSAVLLRREVAGEREAAEAAMHGSPTLLIDGGGPVRRAGQAPVCRAGCTAARPVPLENRIRLVSCRSSVRQAACVIRPLRDLLCVDVGHGGAGNVRVAVGDVLCDALVRLGRVVVRL